MDRKKKLAVGRGISVGRSVEEIVVTRALNDVPDTPILPSITGSGRAPPLLSKSTSALGLGSRAASRAQSGRLTGGGGLPQVDDWGAADGGKLLAC